MAKEILNLGTADQKDGDTLRGAFQKVKNNFDEVYSHGVTPLFSNVSDLPTASDWHGMFAHVHGTNSAYFAHAGNWVKIRDFRTATTVTKNASNVCALDLNDNDNFILEVSGVWSLTVTASASMVGHSGTIIIKNTATTTPASLPSNLKTPNGETIVWQTDSGDLSLLSYIVVDANNILVNYVGNFS